ncbi:MAG: cytochrome c maturation protein CcmE, partial [candidate division NC10 bacterium]
MKGRKLKYLLAGGIVVAALAGMIYSGVKESMVYFYTPTELVQKKDSVRGKSLRERAAELVSVALIAGLGAEAVRA